MCNIEIPLKKDFLPRIPRHQCKLFKCQRIGETRHRYPERPILKHLGSFRVFRAYRTYCLLCHVESQVDNLLVRSGFLSILVLNASSLYSSSTSSRSCGCFLPRISGKRNTKKLGPIAIQPKKIKGRLV